LQAKTVSKEGGKESVSGAFKWELRYLPGQLTPDTRIGLMRPPCVSHWSSTIFPSERKLQHGIQERSAANGDFVVWGLSAGKRSGAEKTDGRREGVFEIDFCFV